MSKLVIFGATGQQGHAILSKILTHPTLSKKYSLRGITRNTSSPKAQDLATRGVEMIAADIDIPTTLPNALADAKTVILITETQYESDLKEREFAQAKAVADAAVLAGVEYFIFSTAVHCCKLWDGGAVDQFDSKAEIEIYLRGLPFKTAYIAPGMFMQNLVTVMAPRRGDDGSYVIVSVNDPDTKVPLIDAVGDTGAYLVPLLEDPERVVDGKVIYAASGVYSFSEIAEIIGRVSGETVKYVRIPGEVYQGFMKEEQGGRMLAMMNFFDHPGYFGAGTEEKVEETARTVKGLTSFEEFAGKFCVTL
ncbi:hypothetical protein BDW59DRAFT_177845 [Aspergillus cavernicola]|uniref:NmrA-like domain-containing protein n=1 Tax=Aspergillus cavernicola TaxID=176166 RepID=A0ABR4IS55_9EURO